LRTGGGVPMPTAGATASEQPRRRGERLPQQAASRPRGMAARPRRGSDGAPKARGGAGAPMRGAPRPLTATALP